MRFDLSTAAAVLFPVLGAIACGGAAPEPQTPASPATPAVPSSPATPAMPAAAGGGATEMQVAMGKKVYADKCASCHGANGEGDAADPPVVGKMALTLDPPAKARVRKVQFKTAADVAKFVKNAMPMDSPGSLNDEDTNAVVAWDLKANGIKFDKKVDAASAPSINLR